MNTNRLRRTGRVLDRLQFLGPILIAATALLVAACNNGSGGTTY
jgi:hypothetical protein